MSTELHSGDLDDGGTIEDLESRYGRKARTLADDVRLAPDEVPDETLPSVNPPRRFLTYIHHENALYMPLAFPLF
jgi:hypothetical protein